MSFPALKAVGNILVHVPEMLQYGTTIQQETIINPESGFLKEWKQHVRSFAEAVKYAPNQAFIGNISPLDLRRRPQPWYANLMDEASAKGHHGEIFDAVTFYAALKIADTFDLVLVDPGFASTAKALLAERGLFSETRLAALDKVSPMDEIAKWVDSHKALPLLLDGQMIGCVRQAHDSDVNLNAHVMLDNLANKASGILAVLTLLQQNGISPDAIDYLIDTSEEAVGDMNQRGGGNMAKAIGDICGLVNATGCDVRGFCAGPTHGILHAAAMVKSGMFKNILVFGGGCVAKLAMNGRDHVAKGLPILEDMLGGFAVLIGEDDGESPLLRTDIVGRHRIASGAAPQAVIQAIVCDPLDGKGMKITDIDLYAPELQNPEITLPAGAGDVPLANYKMIGAMAVKRGEIDRAGLPAFVDQIGVPGFAPTQGHIPSGVPILGYARDSIMAGSIKRAMVVGKGSLFLGRMTDLFDGVSIVIEANELAPREAAVDLDSLKGEIMAALGDALVKAASDLARR